MKRFLVILGILACSLQSFSQVQTIYKGSYRPNTIRADNDNEAWDKVNVNDIYLNSSITTNTALIDAVELTVATNGTDIDDLENMVDNDNSTFSGDSAALGAVYYTDTYYDDIRVPLNNTKLTPTKSEPVLDDIGDGILAYGFDADADSTEALHFVAQMPHGWKIGTNISAHIHWMPSTTNEGNVLWKMKYRAAGIDSVFTAVDSFYLVDAGDGTAWKHQIFSLGNISSDSIGGGVSGIIIGSIARVGEDGTDTYTGSAYGLEIDFHYQIDAPGSPETFSKGY